MRCWYLWLGRWLSAFLWAEVSVSGDSTAHAQYWHHSPPQNCDPCGQRNGWGAVSRPKGSQIWGREWYRITLGWCCVVKWRKIGKKLTTIFLLTHASYFCRVREDLGDPNATLIGLHDMCTQVRTFSLFGVKNLFTGNLDSNYVQDLNFPVQ